MKKSSYVPIDCNFYDRLEAAAVKREKKIFEFQGLADKPQLVEGIIVDLFIVDHVEYLRLDTGKEIRLDRIIRMGNDYLPGTPFCKVD